MLNSLIKYLPDNYEEHHTYLLEYNFTTKCYLMQWQDEHVRVVYHNSFGHYSNEFIGTETIRPANIFDQTTVISTNVTEIDLRN